ncbi:hypothetical protein NUU61_004891 [Penicillium alfredii]|uniref:Transcription elongation factor Eaf N-terminal domain-containing protein n=1 Tax=Penicillium alfredii TaxID=1506179 RepID=A0A9W9K7D4_9EURO|nr:uncharacterized protein NUU61_004891 [Penicillium alfredii]KAJ5095535.1 hypothetical protein NUU61_004891 [Penicillium alfredii]
MAAPALSTMIDPTKQAEYPVVLGERLAANANPSHLVNINYNYKTKLATPQQRSTITRSAQSLDFYDLAITDQAPNADHSLSYSYHGSEDPVGERNLVLVFDADRKVFVLEPVSTKLNFNLQSAPGKTEKQVLEQYEQLRIFHEEDPTSGDDRNPGSTSEDEGPADESNPYDFRHFLPKSAANDKSASNHTTPEPPTSTSKANTPLVPAAKPTPKLQAPPQSKAQTNPLRQKKKPPAKPPVNNPPPPTQPTEPPPSRSHPPDHEESRSSPSDAGTGTASQQANQSPISNIIVDGDLIIDMGSPPPSRPSFRVNPAYFSSNNTPADEGDDGDEEMEGFRLPSPVGKTAQSTSAPAAAPADGDNVEDDDALAAEMEAAFEESAREEEARSQQYSQPAARQYPSDDESEVSEEE